MQQEGVRGEVQALQAAYSEATGTMTQLRADLAQALVELTATRCVCVVCLCVVCVFVCV